MSWGADLLNFIFPQRCHVCDCSLAPHERFACRACLDRLPRSGYHRRNMNPMEERFAGVFPFEKATGHFLYSRDSALSTLIQDMKYRKFPSIGDMLGKLAASELYPTGFFADIDVILPVPMHFLKKAKRGYNQTERIARGISEATGIPVAGNLRMIRRHSTQTSLNREERMANNESLFALKNPGDLKEKGILLVDDVCTTGATLMAASRAIHDALPGCRLTLFTIGVTF